MKLGRSEHCHHGLRSQRESQAAPTIFSMAPYEVEEESRSIPLAIAERATTVGEIADMSASDAGLFLLKAMHDSRPDDWSTGNMGAHAMASIEHSRAGARPSSSISRIKAIVVDFIADGMSWLISAGLVGPSAAQSGSSSEWRITSAGREALEHGTTTHVEATRRLHVDLHPALQGATRMNFERGELAAAVQIAMKEVEISLRAASGLPARVSGKALASEALKVGGPFRLTAETPDESDGFMYLFMGAAAALRNPNSHRTIEYTDPTEAADIIHLADLLLRVIEREKTLRLEAG